MPLDKCPDTQTLEQLLLGKLPAEQFELLSSHLEKCPTCTKTAETLIPVDEVTNALKAVTVLGGDEELLAQAIERGKQLGSQAPTLQPDATVIGSAAESPAESNAADGFTVQKTPTELSFLAPPQQPDELGRLGTYRILQILGVGGMGIVFRAEDPALRRQVALKVMKPTVAMNRSAKDRFLREAQFTAAIEHDNIVAIYQVGEDQGVPFIAMPLLKGESLKARLERDGKLSQADVLRIGREIASGLAAAHERDLIHRDIKPDNIWLEEKTNRARILDFGLVRAASEDAGLTQSGTVMGTPRYMAPEQAMGQDVDFRCDLFSLGAVLYHLVSGKLPFEGSNVTATLMAVVQKDPLPLERAVSGLHPTLGKLIHKLMAKDREKRPKSAKEIAKLLAAIHQDLRQSASRSVTSPAKESPAEGAVLAAEVVTLQNTSAPATNESPRTLSSPATKSPTEPLAALPVILTEPSATISGRKASKRTQALSDRRPPGKPPVKKLLAALGAGGILLTLLGIIVITITNKDGKKNTIRLSEGTETDVAAEPGSKVSIRQESQRAESTTAPTADAALAEYFALNRRAAEKALAVGGPNSFVGLEDMTNHQWHFSSPGETLPDGPFLVRKWSIMNSTTATNADLEVLRGLRHIRDINLGTTFHRLDAAALQHIAAIRAPLEYLSFHSPIKTSDLSALPSFQQLHTISVLGPDVDDNWAFVKKFPHLRALIVNSGPWPDLLPLGEFPHLRVLSLIGEDPDLTAVSQLQQKNPQLRVLSSRDFIQHRVIGRDPLREAVPGLLKAGLPLTANLFDGSSKPIQPDEVDSLFASGVSHIFCPAIPSEIRLTGEQRQQIMLLSLEDLFAHGQQEADLLAASLSDRNDMRSLHLQGSDLTDAGLKHLEALVGLSGLNVNGTKVTPAGLKAFRVAVPDCTLTTSDGTLDPDYLREPAGANRSASLSQNGWPADAPRPAIAPFDTAQATAHQEAWAKYLGIPVEYTNSVGMRFRLIPPGEFIMGSTQDDVNAQLKEVGDYQLGQAHLHSETPQHKVVLTQPFYLGMHEVTQQAYAAVMGSNPSSFATMGTNPTLSPRVAGIDTSNFPVEDVNWFDAHEFSRKLSEKESLEPNHSDPGMTVNPLDSTGYRLPTEAEWEYACRAGTTTRYWVGDTLEEGALAGWFNTNCLERTHSVGETRANPFGLYDMHGNVAERVEDYWAPNYYEQLSGQEAFNPAGPGECAPYHRGLRGGGWYAAPAHCQSGRRASNVLNWSDSNAGFRVVLPLIAVRKALKSE